MNITSSTDLKEASAVVIPVNGRGSVAGRDMEIAAYEFPISFQQYQRTCGRTEFRPDATGKVKKRPVVTNGDVLVFSDVPAEAYRQLLAKAQDPEFDPTDDFRRDKKHIFYPVVKTRPDKAFSVESFRRAMKQAKNILIENEVPDVTFLLSASKALKSELESTLEEVFSGSDISITVVF